MKLSLILSTGRTGTKFFAEYLSDIDDIVCLHEPKPSRRFKLISNLYLSSFLTDRQVVLSYKISRCRIRRKYYDKRNVHYIESNNFLFGCVKPLAKEYQEVKVLHIVRDPVSYIRSHLGHGFWLGHKRIAARFLPFWLEDIDTSVLKSKNPYEILAHRWVYVNGVISSYKEITDYCLINFEDLFVTDDWILRLDTMNRIRKFFNIEEIPKDSTLEFLNSPVNRSSKNASFDQFDLSKETKELISRTAEQYGYSYLNQTLL